MQFSKQAFFDAKFPGMQVKDGPVSDVIKLMTSSKPDSSIKAVVSLDGGYNPCEYNPSNETVTQTATASLLRIKRSTEEECNNGFVLDAFGDLCYNYYNLSYDLDTDACNDYGADLISFNDDDEIQAFINITSSFGGNYSGEAKFRYDKITACFFCCI